MSSQDTQVKNYSCIFLPTIKLNSLIGPQTCGSELFAYDGPLVYK